MGKIITRTTNTPLLFQSKLLCFSLFYLFTTLLLSFYTIVSQKKCLFRSSPFDPIQSPLFSYPSSYGEHKYALPTHRSACSSPVFFSDYYTVVKEIRNICQNASASSVGRLNYIQAKSESFGGNFSDPTRFSYLNPADKSTQVPCGFLKEFPISNSDRIAMENCRGVVVVSAIFSDHDKIRQPKGLGSQTLDNICFFMFVDETTLKGLDRHNLVSSKSSVGVWKIVKVEDLYENPAMNGVIPKYLVHRLFPNSKFSIWIDAKLQLVIDPLLLIHSLIVSADVDMAISKHPFFVHTMEEAMATARWKKWGDVHGLRRQMETYCRHGLQPWSSKKLPYPSDVPDSALILRKHGEGSNRFSCLVFNELEVFNPRDQLAFAFVRDLMSPKLKLNMFEVEVFEHVAVEYRHNLKRFGQKSTSTGSANTIKTKTVTSYDFKFNESSCHNYLLEMWGD